MKPINLLSIGIASDHAGYDLKEAVKNILKNKVLLLLILVQIAQIVVIILIMLTHLQMQ